MPDREQAPAPLSSTPAGPNHVWLHGLNLLLLCALWLFTVATYTRLPELIPAHVGFGGVTRWTTRPTWFLLPILGTFSAVLVYLISMLTTVTPSELNVPYRKRLQALPPAGQLSALAPLRVFTWAMAGWLLLLMLLIQHQLYRIALDETAQAAAPGPLLWITAGMMILLAAGVAWLYRAVRQEIEAFEGLIMEERNVSGKPLR
jgi:hypothetical protein